jgi:hypothetical protein
MKNRFLTIFFLFTFFSCIPNTVSSNPYIEIDGQRLYLRENNRNDVENILGQPFNTKFYEHGAEDIQWRPFTVASYDKLAFNYDIHGNIIMITISNLQGSTYWDRIRISDGLVSEITFDSIIARSAGAINRHLLENRKAISFSERNSFGDVIGYAYWFDENSKLIHYIVHYVSPWY